MPPVISTNVPAVAFSATGFVSPSEASILAGVQSDINAAFGANLNFALNTPQGQLSSSMAAIIGNADDQFVFLSNMFDPAYSYGRWQDALARIYFLERDPAEPTVVSCTCSGAGGVVIPAGALALDTSGNTYSCISGGTIAGIGSVTLDFQNIQVGPIPCPAGTLTTIYQTIPGWDSITNPDDGVIGQNTETRAAFEQRREDSVASNSLGPIGAIIGEVAQVPGVLDYFGYNNNTSSPVTLNGVTIAAYGIYIAVVGGSQNAIAQAILNKKGPGAPMSGNTTITAYDSNPLYAEPIPYQITFEIPTDLEILFAVNLVNSNSIPSNAAALIQNAVIGAFAGEYSTVPRPRINSLLLASAFSSLVQTLGAWAQVRSLQIGSINTAGAQFTATISGTNMTVSAVASGTIIPDSVQAPGQTLIDSAGLVPAGTAIVSQTSGTTGGIGVYVISNSVTVASGETMYGVFANQNSVQVQANQEPVTGSTYILVTVS